MPTEINPFIPDENLRASQVLEIYMEALQDWFNRVHKPYIIQGKRQQITLQGNDLIVIMTILRQLVINNEEQVERWLEQINKGTSDE